MRDVVDDALDSFVDTVGAPPPVASTIQAALARLKAKAVR
jgi:hypothetical protein